LDVGYALSLQADEPLRLRAVAGDEAAFESLLRPLVEPGLRLALSMLGDRRDAEDATQEALTRANVM
jgi:DNA-directed RNA polymerase specialized sigma24 family protein